MRQGRDGHSGRQANERSRGVLGGLNKRRDIEISGSEKDAGIGGAHVATAADVRHRKIAKGLFASPFRSHVTVNSPRQVFDLQHTSPEWFAAVTRNKVALPRRAENRAQSLG